MSSFRRWVSDTRDWLRESISSLLVWREAEARLRRHGYTAITLSVLNDVLPEWTTVVEEYPSFEDKVRYVVHEAIEIEEVYRRLGRWIEPRFAAESGLITEDELMKIHLLADKISPVESHLKWVKDSAGIYWSSSKSLIHSLYYDEEDDVYVWYAHRIEDFEELKREIFFPPIYSCDVLDAKNIDEAKRMVEESLREEELVTQHQDLVDEIVKAHEMAYKRLRKIRGG